MKTLIFIISIIVFTFSATAQSPCPTVSVIGPSGIVPIGESMTFTAKVEGIDLSKIEYKWTVSGGKIVGGQGTSTITVATNADTAGQTITALVKISGLAERCKNEATGFGETQVLINSIGYPTAIDYRNIPWRDEMARLANVAVELVNDEKVMAYFIVYTNEKRYSQSLKIREARIRKYFFEKYKISKERIRLVYGGKGNYRTSVWKMPIDKVPPQ